MTRLWPHLPTTAAAQELQGLDPHRPPTPATGHPAQIYSPLGGTRARERDVAALTERLDRTAAAHGHPEPLVPASRVAFDRAATPVLHDALPMSWHEAGNRDLWSFIALVALPHLTHWRFGVGNAERWLATDLTRHTWARLWWRAVVFRGDPELLDALTESDLNQLLERRSLGGDPRLVRALARAVLDTTRGDDTPDRRPLIRDATARLRRRLAFIDTQALTDDQTTLLCRTVVQDSASELDPTSTAGAGSPPREA